MLVLGSVTPYQCEFLGVYIPLFRNMPLNRWYNKCRKSQLILYKKYLPKIWIISIHSDELLTSFSFQGSLMGKSQQFFFECIANKSWTEHPGSESLIHVILEICLKIQATSRVCYIYIYLPFVFVLCKYCWWKKILHHLIGSTSHHLQSFIHSRWCRISSINRF